MARGANLCSAESTRRRRVIDDGEHGWLASYPDIGAGRRWANCGVDGHAVAVIRDGCQPALSAREQISRREEQDRISVEDLESAMSRGCLLVSLR